VSAEESTRIFSRHRPRYADSLTEVRIFQSTFPLSFLPLLLLPVFRAEPPAHIQVHFFGANQPASRSFQFPFPSYSCVNLPLSCPDNRERFIRCSCGCPPPHAFSLPAAPAFHLRPSPSTSVDASYLLPSILSFEITHAVVSPERLAPVPLTLPLSPSCFFRPPSPPLLTLVTRLTFSFSRSFPGLPPPSHPARPFSPLSVTPVCTTLVVVLLFPFHNTRPCYT